MSTDNTARADVPQLILVGASGVGKTTVGRIIADRLGLNLVDVDEAVESALGQPMGMLVVQRDPRLESTRRTIAIESMSAGGVLVLGASQIDDEAVARSLAQARLAGAQVVELTAGIADVSRRLGLNAPRSLALGAPRAMLTKMMADAHERYLAVADHSVNTGGLTAVEVADTVCAACRLAADSQSPEVR